MFIFVEKTSQKMMLAIDFLVSLSPNQQILEIRAWPSKISFYLLVRNIEMQRQRDRQMELSNRAHVQFQEDSMDNKEKGKYSVEASREMARIQAGIYISQKAVGLFHSLGPSPKYCFI